MSMYEHGVHLSMAVAPPGDHYVSVIPLIRTDTYMVGNCPGGDWGVVQIRGNTYRASLLMKVLLLLLLLY